MKKFCNHSFVSTIIFLFFITLSSHAQVFNAKKTLYTTGNGFVGWYTGNEYSAVDSYNGSVYFIMLDNTSRPFIGKITNGVTTLEALEKNYPNYIPTDDGHHEFSIGIDRDGYIHVTGDMHNFPDAEISTTLPTAYKSANMLYWKSTKPGDITSFKFTGLTAAETIPGKDWSYGHFVTDRNQKLYYITRTLARTYYYQNGGRGLGLYSYDETTKKWKAYGTEAPISDASYPVVAWEESGQAGGSYQQYKADICFDKNNRMYLTTGMNTQNGAAQVNSVVFAFSDDGGTTFHKANTDLITLPMQIASGTRQGDVVDCEPASTFEQPSVTYAFNNQPIIQYNVGSTAYYKYWTGTAWSTRATSPSQGNRGRVLYNDFTNQLYFINIQSGTIYAKTSFTSSTTSYDAGETFRCYDIQLFQSKNILNGMSWTASTGKFEIIQLIGDTTLANSNPTCAITAPINNATYVAPTSITLTATATDADGTISKVEFYNGTTLLGSDATSPYAYTWSNVTAGNYSITAKATNDKGATTTSTAIAIIVTSSVLTTITSLTLIDAITTSEITNYTNLLTVTTIDKTNITTTEFNIYVNVTGTVDSVVFTYTLNGNQGTRLEKTPPYALRGDGAGYTSWDMPVGNYTITAKAYDLGVLKSTKTITFEVIDVSTDINTNNNKETFFVYPNPATNLLIVTDAVNSSSHDYSIVTTRELVITNTLGQIVFSQPLNNSTSQQLNITQLPLGLYFIKIGNQTQKLIKQ